jgi:hypothetical protein
MADKKISQLPLIQTISGSTVVVPIVHDGTTIQMSVERLSLFTSQFSATTGSNTFIGNQTITGNTSIGGNLVVAGKLTAQEFHTEITSASIIFESGSSQFGNSGDDTHTFTGSIILNGSAIGAGQLNAQTASQDLVNRGISSVTGSINTQSSSQDLVNRQMSSTTGSINTTTSSFDSVFLRISSTTGSMNTQSSSQDLVNRQISSTTGSINTTTSSFDSVFLRISSTTGSINVQSSSQDLVNLRIASTTGSINTTTSSFDSVFLRISSTTGSINTTTSSFDSVFLRISSTTGSMNTQSSSQDLVNRGISSVTGSINTTTSSFDSVFLRISSTTGSINVQSSSQDLVNRQISLVTGSIHFVTGALNAFTGSVIGQTNTISTFTASVNFTTQSLNTQTGSQQSMNTTLSIVTGSMRAEIGGIEAYTASLKSAIIVNGTNVRIIGELTASRIYTEFITSSVLFVTGSNIIGDQSSDKHEFTGSVNINDTLFIKGQAIGFGELNAFTGSQINKDFTLSKVTASIDAHILKQSIQTGSQDLVNLGISTYTGSQNVINSSVDSHILKQAIQTGSQDLVNLGISTYTGSQNVINSSVDAHILKQATQTGSQDLVNYNISIVTSSIDAHILKQSIQTGSQDLVNLGISTFTGSLRSEVNLIEAYTASLKGAAIVSSSQQITNYYKFAETASANIFYGNQTFASSGGSGLRVYGGAGTHQWDMYLNGQNIRLSDNTAGDGALIVDTRAYFGGHVTASGNISVGGSGFISPGGADKFIGVYSGQDSSIILQDSVETWEIYMNDDLYFTTGSTSPKNVMSLRRITGNVEINEGNLVIGKAGKGIDFSITSNGSGTMTSEILSDYEEGTWTPTFAGTGGNTGQVYGSQDGTYTKVGRLVTFTANVSLTTLGTITGFVRIDGLPFTPQSVPGSRPATTHATGTTITTLPASDVYGGNTFMYLYKISQTNPTAATQLSQGDLTNTTNWQVNGFYYTA